MRSHPALSARFADVTPIPPMFEGTLPGSPKLVGAVASPDGSSIWVIAEEPVVDVGELLNLHAATLVSALAGLIVIVLLIFTRRAARRRRTVGALHCAKCDYDVTSLVPAAEQGTGSVRCPECGVDLARRKPRPGQRTLRRIAPPLALAALTIAVAAVYATVGRKLIPGPFPEGRWASFTLYDWSRKPSLGWVGKAASSGEKIVQVNAADGSVRRTVCRRVTRTYFPPQYVPGADAILLADGPYAALVSVKDGSTVARLHESPSGPARGLEFLVGRDATGDVLWLSCTGGETGAASHVTEWNWRTGQTRRLAQTDAFVTSVRQPWARHFLVIPGPPLRIVVYPDFMENMENRNVSIKLLDEEGKQIAQWEAGRDVDSTLTPSLSIDGRRLFVASDHGANLMVYATDTQTRLPTMATGSRSSWPWQAHDPLGRFMLVPVSDGVQLIRDGTPVAKLTHSPTVFASRSFSFSSDGLTVCAVAQATNAGVNWFMVWRIPPTVVRAK